ncbi:hypothetical protein DFQ26_007820 [Actinomortierella ambigua]|nr:hypothetical protein DFQ26_007820 [Actinomortierella ambigua]
MSVKRSTDPGEGSSSAQTKRVRFGRDNDDSPLSFEEVDDSDLLEKRKQRRGAVKLQGYREDDNSSDEEDGGGDGSRDRKGKAKEKKKSNNTMDDDDDEDMFGDGSAPKSKAKKGKAGSGSDEDEDEEAQHEYAEFVEKEKIARWKDSKGRAGGPGLKSRFDRSEAEGEATIEDADQEYDSDGNPKIESFNMRAEIDDEGGHIDRDGNFIRAKEDPDRFHDNWLDGISRKDIAAAKEAEERKRQLLRIQEREEQQAALTKDDIYLELVNLLKPSETVLEAIQRLGGRRGDAKAAKGAQATKKKSWQKSKQQQQQQQQQQTTAEDKSNGASAEAAENKRLVEKVTDLSDKMMGMGHFDIYETTYERIVRELRRADLIAEDWIIGTPVPKPGDAAAMLLDDLDDPLFGTTPAEPVSWEYKWATSNAGEGQEQQQGEQAEEEEVFGPFTGAQMTEWRKRGFFDQGILVRMVGDKTFEPDF